MKKKLLSVIALALAAAAPLPAVQYVPEPHNRERMNMNAAWKYIRQNVSGAEQRTFNDSAWSTVGLPHSFNAWRCSAATRTSRPRPSCGTGSTSRWIHPTPPDASTLSLKACP